MAVFYRNCCLKIFLSLQRFYEIKIILHSYILETHTAQELYWSFSQIRKIYIISSINITLVKEFYFAIFGYIEVNNFKKILSHRYSFDYYFYKLLQCE